MAFPWNPLCNLIKVFNHRKVPMGASTKERRLAVVVSEVKAFVKLERVAVVRSQVFGQVGKPIGSDPVHRGIPLYVLSHQVLAFTLNKPGKYR